MNKMCAVSMVTQYEIDRWNQPDNPFNPYMKPAPLPQSPNLRDYSTTVVADHQARIEIAALRRELEELKKLIAAARAFDEKTNQPDCENDEKVNIVKMVAKALGVDMTGVFE